MRNLTFFISLIYLFSVELNAQSDLKFQVPPKEILELVDVQPAPSLMLDSKGKWLVLTNRDAYMSLEEMAEEEERLAGLRINPNLYCRSKINWQKSIVVQTLTDGKELKLSGLPEKLNFTGLQFSPDEKYLSFLNANENGLEIYLIDLSNGKVTSPYARHYVNAVFGRGYQWSNDGSYLIVYLRSENNSQTKKNALPAGPSVQETSGTKAPARTYQDLLKNPADEKRFDELISSTIIKVSINGKATELFPNGNYISVNESPDGKYILVTKIQKPYSYIVPYYRFSMNERVYEMKSGDLMMEHNRPLIEELPNGFDAVETGIREIDWRSDQPATLYWVEANDKGDPSIEVKYRDGIYQLAAPFDGERKMITQTVNRFSYVRWGNEHMAIVYDNWWRNRNTKVYMIDPSVYTENATVLFDYSSQDYYKNPGHFLTEKNEMMQNTLLFSKDGKKLYMSDEGYSAEGNKPFLAEFDIKSKQKKILWQADGKSTYERFIKLTDPAKKVFLTTIETNNDIPNLYQRTAGSKAKPVQKTFLENPFKKFEMVKKEKIHYKRADGIDLDGMLYLPPGFDKIKSEKLPLILWAYPREYKNNSSAGQVKDSPHKYTRPFYGSMLYWAMRGYAVLDNASFPIVGEGDKEPNDNFIPQLVSNAQAAIDKLTNDGIIDPKRVAVGGHSYGAFMTANLLAHCDLFSCGIARSGAYNRTLTPFGFQSEERTFWEAKDLYLNMSPFYHAEKINEPLLMIHGDADNNPGTFTLQSERLFGAIKGLGGTARLVLLPMESHGYSAKENILHMLWEQDEWLKKYCPNNIDKETGSSIDKGIKRTFDYEKLIAGGDKLFFVGKYGEALEKYRDACKMKPDETYPKEQIAKCEAALVKEKEYQECIATGDRYINEKKWDEAIKMFQKASDLKPSENYPKEQLHRAKKAKESEN